MLLQSIKITIRELPLSTSAKILGFWTPLPPSSAFHATYQYYLSAKSGNSQPPHPPQCGRPLCMVPYVGKKEDDPGSHLGSGR